MGKYILLLRSFGVVAGSCVEYENDLAFASDLGVPYGQGYIFGKPDDLKVVYR